MIVPRSQVMGEPARQERRRILFLFSDTGGGHRGVAEALIAALQRGYGGAIATEMVDFLRQYGPGPFGRFPAWYPSMVRVPQLWGLGYRLCDGRRRVRFLTGATWSYVEGAIRKMLDEHPCEMIVATHPLILDPVARIVRERRSPPMVTVVTDLVSTHAFWYHPGTDLCLVPTGEAYRRGLRHGLPEEKLRVTGLPVMGGVNLPDADRQLLRRELGWPDDLPMVLLMGGGEGMGRLEPIAHAVASAGLNLGLAVVAGRNAELYRRLDERRWPLPVRIYGFVGNIPALMAAADILVTKAGPSTVSEALVAGLPMILHGRLPGQEDGNVSLVTEAGAGVWAPTMGEILSTLREWIEHPGARARAAVACRRLARPHAAQEIADLLAERLGVRS